MKKLFLLSIVTVVFGLHAFSKSYYQMAEEAYDSDSLLKASLYVEKAIKADPKNCDAYVLQGDIYIYYDNVRALSSYNKAIKYAKKSNKYSKAELYVFRSIVYMEMGDTLKAVKDLNSAIKNGKKNPIGYVARGDYYYDIDEYDAALSDYNTALGLDEYNIRAMYGVAACYFMQSKYDESARLLDKVIMYNPSYAQAYYTRSMVWIYKDNIHKAIDNMLLYFKHASRNINYDIFYLLAEEDFSYTIGKLTNLIGEDDSMNDYWIALRSKVYVKNGFYEEAIRDFNTLELVTNSDLYVLSNRPICYVELGKYREAISDYTAYISIDSTSADIYTFRAEAYNNIGEYDKAQADYAKALTIAPVESYIYLSRGSMKDEHGDYDGALADFKKAITLSPDDIYAHLMRGRELVRRGDTVSAKKDFEYILANDTVIAEDSFRQYALVFTGKKAEGMRWMEDLLQEYPNNKHISYNAACLYALAGNKQMAVKYLKQSINQGFVNWHRISVDRDLDSIRECEEYLNLKKINVNKSILNLLDDFK